jgi:PHIKZ066
MNYVNERERGQLPLSIGTSLAFESMLNTSEIIKHDKPLYVGNGKVWINIKTLYRNIYGSVHRENIDRTSDSQFADAMFSEIDLIKDICREEANGIEPVFYCPNYVKIDNFNNETLLRLDNTSLQQTYTKRMTNCLKIVLPEFNKSKELTNPNRIRIYDNFIEDIENQNTLMITHYAFDLLSFRKFKNLTLLETHTGKAKGRELWYTKYYNGKDLPELPFRLDLLTLLGDGTLFRNKVPKFKKEIIRMAKDYHWSSITTTDKIRHNISDIKDHQIRMRLLSCIKNEYC